MSTAPRAQVRPTLVLYAAVAACGLAAAGFATVWTAVAPPVFGMPSLRESGVTLAMLAGLVIGVLAAGRISGPLREPRRTFGLLLVGAAASAFAAFLLLPRIERLYAELSGAFHGAAAASLGGMALVFVVLLVPAFLLGAALLYGWRLVSDRGDRPGSPDGFFPAALAGIAIGAGITSFILMPYLGAGWALGILTLVVAAAGAAFLTKCGDGEGAGAAAGSAGPVREGTGAMAASEDGRQRPDGSAGGLPVVAIVAYLAYVFSGAACAIVWTRFLAQVVGKTVYLSAAMLTVYFAALALGSLAATGLAGRIRRPGFPLGVVAALTGVVWLVPFMFVNRLPFAFLRFFSLAPRLNAPEWQGIVFAYFALCFALMFLPGLLAGFCLPLAARSLARGQERRARDLLIALAVIILGVGLAIVAGLVVPRTGLTTRRVLVALPWLAILAGVAHLVEAARSLTSRIIVGVVVVAGAAALSLAAPPWNRGVAASGLYANPEKYLYVTGLRGALETEDVPFYEEDGAEAVAVVRSPDGAFLRVNGYPYQSTADDLAAQVLAAEVPMLLASEPRRVLLLGLGTGVTLASALAHDITDVECIEPTGAILRASRYFARESRSAPLDPRVRLIGCDPSNYLLGAQQTYDTIISQALMPPAGLAGLARARLASGGILVQVADLDVLSEAGFKALVKELAYYFPHLDLWWGGGTRLMLVASLQPMRLALPVLAERMRRLGADSGLASLGISDEVGFLACYMMGRETLLGLVGDASLAARDRSTLNYLSPRKRAGADNLEALVRIDTGSKNAIAIVDRGDDRSFEYTLADERLERGMLARRSYFRSLVAARDRKLRDAQRYLDNAKADCPSNGIFKAKLSDFYVSLARTQAERGQIQDAINAARRAIEESPMDHRGFYNLASLEIQRNPATAASLLGRAIELNPDYLPAYLLRAQAELAAGQADLASESVARVLSREPLNLRARHLRALCFIRRGLLEAARDDLKFVLEAEPDNADALGAIAYTWLLQDDVDKGRHYYERALKADPSNLEAMSNLATILAEKGEYDRAIRIWEKALELDPGNSTLKQNLESARQKASGEKQ